MRARKEVIPFEVKGPFRCARCTESFPTKPEFQKHYFRAHFQHLMPNLCSSIFTCKLCHTKLRSKGSLNTHMETCHVKGGLFPCDRCSCCYNTKLGFQKHYNRHSGDFSPAFPLKESLPAKREDPNGSEMLSHKSRFRNVPCSNNVANERIIKAADAYPFKCDLCSMLFSSTSNRKVHMKSSHIPDGKYKCTLCPCAFSSEISRKTHHNFRHSPNNAVKSTSASKLSKNISYTKIHLRNASPNTAEKSNFDAVKSESRSTESYTKILAEGGSRLTKIGNKFCCKHCDAEFLTETAYFAHCLKQHKSKVQRVNMDDLDMKSLLNVPFHIVYPSTIRKAEKHEGTMA